MKNKKIGIVGWNTGDNSFGITKPYAEWLSLFGTIHIIAPQTGMVEGLDLLVLPGGLDLNPANAGNLPSFHTTNTDVMKQYFYDVNLDQYLEAKVPIFGICLGFQQLCTKFGGTLEQNVYVAHSTKGRHELVDELLFTNNIYSIITKDSLKQIKKYEVNSLHHQGCYDLNEDMILARETNFGNIEIAKFNETTYGVQFHPEEINDSISNIIVNKLLKNVYKETLKRS
jgi:putative glutamine amidotransferase